jgi:uncharacterized protein YcfL
MKTKLSVILLASLLLTGCEQPQVVSEKRILMEVVSVKLNSKSNSKVDLREVKGGYVYRDQRLSCSKTKAKNIKIGSRWDVVEVQYVYPESKRYFSKLVGTEAICARSN